MESVRWAFSLLVGVPAVLLILLNALSLFAYAVSTFVHPSGRGYSFCPPFLPGIAGAIAILIYPDPEMRSYAWLPLILDLSIPLIVGYWMFRGFSRLVNRTR